MKGTVGRLLAATVTIAALGGAHSVARAAEPLPAPNAVVAKTGDVRITRATVERWVIAMRGVELEKHEPAGPVTASERRETLQLLLYLHMTVEEARRQGLKLRFGGAITREGGARSDPRDLAQARDRRRPQTLAHRSARLRGARQSGRRQTAAAE